MRKRITALFLGFLLVAWGWFFVFPQVSEAAPVSLYLGPSGGTFTVGSTFTVSLYLNTGGSSINAIEANLSFPPDKLQVVTPSAGKSLIEIWVNQPSFSNENGTLRFQGTVPSPGINTESGLISTVTFRVKSTGQAIIKILDDSRVLLNDGKGTDALGQVTNGIYNFVLPPPAGPIVNSPTHPDQEKWYQTDSVVFNWEHISGVEGFSYILSDSPIDLPDDISEGVKNSVTYKGLPSATYYFHIKSLRAGTWGGVSHYAVNIDNVPPAAFSIEISPGTRTSNRFPVISFETTDSVSGIDRYELKFISLSKNLEAEDLAVGTPFFIEATSPYSRELGFGSYDVVVRAFDRAGNLYQATKRLSITHSLFEFVGGEGLKFKANLILPWPWVWVASIILLLVLGYFAKKLWDWHREVERYLDAGAHAHPSVSGRVKILTDKFGEYGRKFGSGHEFFILVLLIGGMILFQPISFAVTDGSSYSLPIEPPVITLFPNTLGNDEIFYIGGRAGAPEAQVVVYLQEEESGAAISQTVKTDKNGEWFLSFPTFLSSGNYLVWTQLKIGEELSPPSSRLELEVSKSAIQIGERRLSYEGLYFWLFLSFLIILFLVVIFGGYHFYHHRKKKMKLEQELKRVEESIRRGFMALRRDIDSELEILRKAKLSKDLTEDERRREERLFHDLEWLNDYVEKEVWEVERGI